MSIVRMQSQPFVYAVIQCKMPPYMCLLVLLMETLTKKKNNTGYYCKHTAQASYTNSCGIFEPHDLHQHIQNIQKILACFRIWLYALSHSFRVAIQRQSLLWFLTVWNDNKSSQNTIYSTSELPVLLQRLHDVEHKNRKYVILIQHFLKIKIFIQILFPTAILPMLYIPT